MTVEGSVRDSDSAFDPRRCAGGKGGGVGALIDPLTVSLSTIRRGAFKPPGRFTATRKAPKEPSGPVTTFGGGLMPNGITLVISPSSRPVFTITCKCGSAAAITLMRVVFTSPPNRNPVDGSTSGASVPRTRCAADFQMMRGSSAPTSVQSAGGRGAAGDCSDLRAIGNNSAEQVPFEHAGKGATCEASSIFLRSTSSTRPAPSTTTAKSLPG